MTKYLYTFLLSVLLSGLYAQDLPKRMLGEKMINDYAEVLESAEEEKLESMVQQFKAEWSAEIVVVLTKGLVKAKANNFAASLSKNWGMGDNSILILADVKDATYGFFTGKNLKETYPEWVIQKIEYNFLKPHFREKDYYEGLDAATHALIGLKSGLVNPDDLKKDSSNGIVIILILVVIFFAIVFPVMQFVSMRKSHFSTKRVDFVSSMVLMNTFGTRGKNFFDDFSHSTGQFLHPSIKDQLKDSFKGGGGIAGSW